MNYFKTKFSIGLLILFGAQYTHAADYRDQAVLNSPVVKALKHGLYQEQKIKCVLSKDENRTKTIQYIDENGLSKFILLLQCSDGRSALIKGVIGDGGQTATEAFKLTYAN